MIICERNGNKSQHYCITVDSALQVISSDLKGKTFTVIKCIFKYDIYCTNLPFVIQQPLQEPKVIAGGSIGLVDDGHVTIRVDEVTPK